MAHVTNDVQAVRGTACEGILTLVDSIVMGGLVIGMMAWVDWQLTLLAFLPFPVLAYAAYVLGKQINQRYEQAQESFYRMSEKVQENISGMRVIKSLGQEEAEEREFSQVLDNMVNKYREVTKIDALYDPIIILLVACSFLISLGIGSMKVWNGEISIGQLTQFNLYLGMLIWPMYAFGWLFNIVEKGKASYDRINRLLSVVPEITDAEATETKKTSGDLRFEIVRFRYPQKGAPALEKIRFYLNSGHTVGIVGKTGSGKTTLLRLLMREYADQEANIFWGNSPIQEYRLRDLRKQIGYVPQDHVLFSATIRENIAFGKPDSSMDEIVKYAKIAQIHEDILSFADGYETVVGERGVTLSGGQKQRISIARALLIKPEVLILDDSLSAVDARTEYQILSHLQTERKGKTTIITAHRLSAVEHADLILVLENGKLLQSGKHQELLAEEGWYRQAYQQQQLERWIKGGERR